MPKRVCYIHISPQKTDTELNPGIPIRETTAIVEEILPDSALAVKAPWNDLLSRGGWTSRPQIQQPCR